MKTRLPFGLVALFGIEFTAELPTQANTLTHRGRLTEHGGRATGHNDFTPRLRNHAGGPTRIRPALASSFAPDRDGRPASRNQPSAMAVSNPHPISQPSTLSSELIGKKA